MRSRKSAETRKTEIVDAALKLADELGPDRLTTQAIAQSVGLTQPGLFRHFPKKSTLWEAVATRIGNLMRAGWDAAADGRRSPSDQIRRLIGTQLRLIQATPAIPAILFSRELHSKNEGLRQAFFGLMGRFHQLIAGLVGQAQMAGELRRDFSPEDAAFLIVGLVQGLAVRWSLSGRRFDLITEGSRLLELQLAGFSQSRDLNPPAPEVSS